MHIAPHCNAWKCNTLPTQRPFLHNGSVIVQEFGIDKTAILVVWNTPRRPSTTAKAPVSANFGNMQTKIWPRLRLLLVVVVEADKPLGNLRRSNCNACDVMQDTRTG